MSCRMIDAYLERRLPGETAAQFEAHLDTCASCRRTVASWRRIRGGLTALLDEQMITPDRADARRLRERADAPKAGPARPLSPAVKWGLAAAFTGLLIGGVALMLKGTARSVPSAMLLEVLQPVGYEPRQEEGAFLLDPTGEDRLLAKLGEARVGVPPESRARVIRSDDAQIRLGLVAGTVGVAFSPTPGRRSLFVEAGGYTVRVVGTRFWVTLLEDGGIEVGVVRGAVQVDGTSEDGPLEVAAGDRLVIRADGSRATRPVSPAEQRRLTLILIEGARDDATTDDVSRTTDDDRGGATDTEEAAPGRTAPSPSEAASADRVDHFGRGTGQRTDRQEVSLDQIKGWILDGEYPRAERALERHLVSRPADTGALMLLASCHSKSGAYDEAARVLRAVADNGTGAQRNRARFKAGMLYQDRLGRPADAAEMFDAYLKADQALRPNTLEARVRLARALQRLGNRAGYRRVLEEIVEIHGGTDRAAEARRQLDRLKGKSARTDE